MEQRVPRQILRRPERAAVLQQRGAADRKQLFADQALHGEARILARAITDGEIDSAAIQLDQRHGGIDMDIDLRMKPLEIAKARQQPFGGEGRRHADRQPA